MNSKLFLSAFLFASVAASAQVSTIDENFSTFTTGANSIPQKNWSKVVTGGFVTIKDVGGTNFLDLDNFNNETNVVYAISPQVVSSTGAASLAFEIVGEQGNPPGVTVELGLVSSPTDMSSFQGISTTTDPTSTGTGVHRQLIVPATSKQYFAFKLSATSKFSSVRITNVKYNANAGTLGVNDYSRSAKDIQFVVNSKNNTLDFVTKTDPKNIQIYSASGQKVAEGKLKEKSFDITQLQTGIYFISIEDNKGSVTKSKFTKK